MVLNDKYVEKMTKLLNWHIYLTWYEGHATYSTVEVLYGLAIWMIMTHLGSYISMFGLRLVECLENMKQCGFVGRSVSLCVGLKRELWYFKKLLTSLVFLSFFFVDKCISSQLLLLQHACLPAQISCHDDHWITNPLKLWTNPQLSAFYYRLH